MGLRVWSTPRPLVQGCSGRRQRGDDRYPDRLADHAARCRPGGSTTLAVPVTDTGVPLAGDADHHQRLARAASSTGRGRAVRGRASGAPTSDAELRSPTGAVVATSSCALVRLVRAPRSARQADAAGRVAGRGHRLAGGSSPGTVAPAAPSPRTCRPDPSPGRAARPPATGRTTRRSSSAGAGPGTGARPRISKR